MRTPKTENWNKLIAVADKNYPDGLIGLYNKGKKGLGDGLAKFIFTELKETFDENATLEVNADEGVRVMNMAIRELEAVRDAIAMLRPL